MKKFSVIITIIVVILLSAAIVIIANYRSNYHEDLHDKVLNMGDSILRYDNVMLRDSVLIPYIMDLKLHNYEMVELPITDTCLVAFCPKESVPDRVFSVFAEFNVVNCWSQTLKLFDELYHPTKEQVINEIKEEFVLYYCGQTVISKSFDSFLFLIEDRISQIKYGCIVKKLILLNSKEDMVMSVTELYNYQYLPDDIIYAQTIIDDNHICHYKEVSVANDCGDEWDNPIEQIETIDFKFDKKGYIIVL